MSTRTPLEKMLRKQDLSRRGMTADDSPLYRLWFEILSLSPSYELARRFRENKGRLSKEDRARLPADFEEVLRIYDDFGDVQRIYFRDWWLDRGMRLLGSRGDRPETEFMFKVAQGQRPDKSHLERPAWYFSTVWHEAQQPDVMVLAVPLNIGRQKALREVKRLIDRHAVPVYEPPPPKYKLADKDMHNQSILDAVRVLYVRAAKPDYKLWQVGVGAKISKTYSEMFDVTKTKRNAMNSEEIRSLEMMTSRKLRQARRLAENAARGIFPSMKEPDYMVDFEPEELQKVITAQLKWRKAENKKLAARSPKP
jgi:hypothetical protein